MRRLLCVALLVVVAGCEEKKTEEPVILLAGTLGNPCKDGGICDQGLACREALCAVAAAAIQVESESGAAIVSGDRLDFGGCLSAGEQLTLRLTVENPGDAELALTGTPRVVISGPAAAEFTVIEEPAATIPAKGSTSVTLLFAPGLTGAREATATIAHSAGSAPYVIALSGKGTSPRLSVSVSGGQVETGAALELGEVFFSEGEAALEVTLSNLGDGPLRLTAEPIVAIAGADAAQFSVVPPESAVIPAEGKAVFTVRFDPASYGEKRATLTVASSDAEMPVFGAELRGKGEFNPARFRVINETFDRSKTSTTARVEGDRLFVGYFDGAESGLRIYDLSANAQLPALLGVAAWDFDPLLEPEGNVIRDVVVNGEVAYVAQGQRGVRVIDLAGTPAAVSVLETSDARDLALDPVRGLLAVADGTGGVALFDVKAEPRAPELAHLLPVLEATSVVFAAGQLVVGDGSSTQEPTLRVYDLADPLIQSALAYSPPAPGVPTALAAAGNLVFVAAGYAGQAAAGGLMVLDLSAVAAAKAPSYLVLTGVSVSELVLDADRLYASVEGAGTKIFAVGSTPESLEELGTIGQSSCNALALSGTTLFCSTYSYGWDQGIQLFDAAEPSATTFVNALDLSSNAQGIAVRGDRAFVAAGGHGMHVADLSERGRETMATAIAGDPDAGFSFDDLAHADGKAYVVSAPGASIRSYGLDAPEAPVKERDWSFAQLTSYGGDRIVLGNGHAYVYGGEMGYGVLIADLSDPEAAPGSFESAVMINSLVVHGTHLYAGSWEALDVYDLADPMHPELKATLTITGVQGMAVAEGRLYVTREMEGLEIYDLANPETPTLLGSLASARGQTFFAVSAIGDKAFVASGGGGEGGSGPVTILMVEAGVPEAPEIEASLALRGAWLEVRQLLATDRDLYLSAGSAGLIILGE